ncbi:Lrp/AsnC family transcriptional regulator [Desulfopila inferna]|uniref:Lrp/AsnC family transcriptional regulator n=1 Tax=Desulfopila inferna TaxID=468528 RepID=UPI00196258BB|nr:Lrp/AsnC ligand binding domain-containing protein [Desulfopila inferna]MBM9606037.1 Lrp/AsnC ligand binding domain-containing protein [Desulfopila inferna]
MVTSIILMNVDRTSINEVAAKLVEFDEISEVYSVSGKYDLIAIVRVRTNDDLSTLVTVKLRNVENITATETMLAFKAYSKHDLESMFSLGLDE